MVENGSIMLKKSKIVVTGGSGRFGKILRKNCNSNYLFPDKKELNILNYRSIFNYLKKKKAKRNFKKLKFFCCTAQLILLNLQVCARDMVWPSSRTSAEVCRLAMSSMIQISEAIVSTVNGWNRENTLRNFFKAK